MFSRRSLAALAGAAALAPVAAAIPALADPTTAEFISFGTPTADELSKWFFETGYIHKTNGTFTPAKGGYPTFDVNATDYPDSHDLVGNVVDWIADTIIDTGGFKPTHVNLTRAAFKHAMRNSLVDYPLSELGVQQWPTLLGIGIQVPHSKLVGIPALAATHSPMIVVWTGTPTDPVWDAPSEIDGKFAPFCEPILDWAAEQQLNGREIEHVYFTSAAFKYAMKNNLIDYVSDVNGENHLATFLGRTIRIPRRDGV